MEKLTMEKSIEYVVTAAGVIAVPALAAKASFLTAILSNQMLAYNIGGFVTVGGLVLGAVGAWAVKSFIYSK